jgi:hypothetical protein
METKLTIWLCMLMLLPVACVTTGSSGATNISIPDKQCLLALGLLQQASYRCASGLEGKLEVDGANNLSCAACHRIFFWESEKSDVNNRLNLVRRTLTKLHTGEEIRQSDGSSLPDEADNFWVRADSLLLTKDGVKFQLPDGHVLVAVGEGDSLRADYTIY